MDIYDYCSEELQAELRNNRELEDKYTAKKILGSEESSSANAMDIETNDEEMTQEMKDAIAFSLGETVVSKIESPFLKESGLPENFTGLYELESIVTHKGRSADSGHYIGWSRQSPGSHMW